MPWFPARTSQAISTVESFVQTHEWACISVAAQLKQRAIFLPLSKRTQFSYFTRKESASAPLGISMENGYGFVYPVLSRQAIAGGAAEQLAARLNTSHRRAVTLMGLLPAVASVESAIASSCGREPRYRVEYQLMVRMAAVIDLPLSRTARACRFIRAEPRHADKLLDMQVAYEQEEVVVDGRKVDPRATRYNLMNDLKEQMVLFAVYDGKAVAKAGTNARGFGFDQIGGVYTVPEFRGQGLSTALMQMLSNCISESKKNTALFVKKTNNSAIAVYDRLGFQTYDGFVIAYYQ